MRPLLTLAFLVSVPATVEPHPCDVAVSNGTGGTTRPSPLSRLAGAFKALVASRRHPRLSGWEMTDVRTQERDPLGELTRDLTLLPPGF